MKFKDTFSLYFTNALGLVSSTLIIYFFSNQLDIITIQFFLITGIAAIVNDFLMPSFADGIVSGLHRKKYIDLDELKSFEIKFGFLCFVVQAVWILLILAYEDQIHKNLFYLSIITSFMFYHRYSSIYFRTYGRLEKKYIYWVFPEILKLIIISIVSMDQYLKLEFFLGLEIIFIGIGLYLCPTLTYFLLSFYFKKKVFERYLSKQNKTEKFDLKIFIRDNWFRRIGSSPVRQAWIPSLSLLGSSDLILITRTISLYGKVGLQAVNILRPYIFGLIDLKFKKSILKKYILIIIWLIGLVASIIAPIILGLPLFADIYIFIVAFLPVCLLSFIGLVWFENPLIVVKEERISDIVKLQFISSGFFLFVFLLIYFSLFTVNISMLLLMISYIFAQAVPAIKMRNIVKELTNG